MKAMVYREYGSPDVLRMAEIERPAFKDDEVLLEVHAAAVTPFDWHFLTGTPYVARIMAGLLKPRHAILGNDVAGRVKGVGKRITKFVVGDDVFGRSGKLGGYAEYVCASEKELWLKPGDISYEEAAAIPLSAITALVGLCELGQMKSGHKVLINGASGGVGTLAVKIAKELGAEVTGVCSSRNLEMVRNLGADRVVDYTQEDFALKEERYDLIFDVVAKRTFADCRQALGPNGIYVTTEFSPTLVLQSQWSGVTGGQRMATMPPRAPGPRITHLFEELLAAGKLTPVIDRSYGLGDVPAAFTYYGKGHPQGRVVISV